MRFMMIVKADDRSEAGELPTKKELAEMTAFNEKLVASGALLAGEGLHPSRSGARVRYGGGRPTVIDGPFAETKELIAGFWIIRADSLDQAIEWAKQVPFERGEVEIRRIFEDDDFGEGFTPELRAREQRMREAIADQG
jgi:hypothetical protein